MNLPIFSRFYLLAIFLSQFYIFSNVSFAQDTIPPVPYCLTGVITIPMPTTGCITIWARDLDRGSYDNVTNSNDLKFYFDGDSTQPSKTICCDDFLAAGVNEELFVDVQMWVEDEAGNRDYCKTTIIIQDNLNVCPSVDPQGLISGSIKNRRGQNVNATISLLKDNNISAETVDISFNFYAFPGTYNICVRRDDNHSNGVSTVDIIKIQRHILGLGVLSHPYLLLAADVNASNSISAADISEIRKLVLGIIVRFGKVPSWVFILQDTSFINSLPNAKFFANYCKTLELGMRSLANIDFTAVKMGDVTEDAKSHNIHLSQTRNQYKNLVYRNAELNNEYSRTDFKLKQDFDLAGMQFTLSFNPNEYEFVKLESGSIKFTEDQFSLHDLDKGKINIAWDGDTNDNIRSTSQNLFSIIWKKKFYNSNVNPLLGFDPNGIEALLIDKNLNEFALQLKSDTKDGDFNIILNQDLFNQSVYVQGPNTYNDKFHYSIFDLNGRKMMNGSVLINESISIVNLPTNSLYILKVQTNQIEKLFKIIKI